MEIHPKKKGMLEFLLILVTGKKMEEKKETKTHHSQTKRHELPTNLCAPFLWEDVSGYPQRFSSRFEDWTPFGESNGPSQ